jgi:hypothetical protein
MALCKDGLGTSKAESPNEWAFSWPLITPDYFIFGATDLNNRQHMWFLAYFHNTVRSLIKLNATITSQLPAGTAKI